MPSLSDVIDHTKRSIGLPNGATLRVLERDGGAVHGKTNIKTFGLNRLLSKPDLLDMRVATFCEKFGLCIGAQIGAKVELEFAGQLVDGRLKLKQFT